jgi:pilus assembly protein CpaF
MGTLKNLDDWPQGLLDNLEPIIPLLEDDSVTEIIVFGYDHIEVKGYGWPGLKVAEGARWDGPGRMEPVVTTIANEVHRKINRDENIFDGVLPGGERVNIIIPPAADNYYITIRKFPKEVMTLEKLLGYGSINDDVADILRSLVAMRKKIIVSGGTESGKTSMLNALSRLIGEKEQIVSMEDTPELQLQSDRWRALYTVKPIKKGVEPVTMADLVKNGLRMSPDRIIVGEVRDYAALDMMDAFSTGHDGGLGTVHADSAGDTFRRLQNLAVRALVNSSNYQMCSLISKGIDVVVFVRKINADNSRKLWEIVEINHPDELQVDGDHIQFRLRTLVRFKQTGWGGLNASGLPSVVGDWVYPSCPSKLTKELISDINRSPKKEDRIKWPRKSLRAKSCVELF